MLQACLVLVEKRETRYRVQWYYRLFEETQRGLTRYPNSVDHIHGSLLALGELLRHTGAHSCQLAKLRLIITLPSREEEPVALLTHLSCIEYKMPWH